MILIYPEETNEYSQEVVLILGAENKNGITLKEYFENDPDLFNNIMVVIDNDIIYDVE